MAWTKKGTAPASFSLEQAFLALITGDATWGWLADWLQLIPPTQFSTADFCASGPIIAAPLVATDFIPTFNPADPRNAVHTASLAALLTAAARDRVFGAYCENVVAGGAPGTWSAPVCAGVQPSTVVDTGGAGYIGFEPVKPGPSTKWARVTRTAWSGTTGGSTKLWIGFWNGSTIVDSGFFFNGTTFDVPHVIAVDASFSQAEFRPLGSTGYTATVCIEWADDAGGTTGHTPTAQPQPSGVLSPLATVDPTLEGIAAELSRHEFKLDFLQSLVQLLVGGQDYIAGPADDPVDLVVDTPLAVGDAVGCILTASSIPASRSLDFGDPQNVVKLAHINFGTSTAWYPSVWMTHTPMVIRPFPPGTTRVTITDLPPGASVQIALISRQK